MHIAHSYTGAFTKYAAKIIQLHWYRRNKKKQNELFGVINFASEIQLVPSEFEFFRLILICDKAVLQMKPQRENAHIFILLELIPWLKL